MDIEDFSVYSGNPKTFGIVDYVVFSSIFILSAAIGFYYAVKDRRQNNMDNYLLANRKMQILPVSLSISVTPISAVSLVSVPAEIYTNGTMVVWQLIGIFFAMLISVHFIIPIFYNLGKTSCYEYLELRFGRPIRMVVTVAFLVKQSLYLAFVIYLPALALESVTGISRWGCMIGVTAVCTLYTTLGGMKTVIWTDSVQFFIIISGLLCLIIRGSIVLGGFENAWNIAERSGRIQFTEISPDPKTRHSVWSVVIGTTFIWTGGLSVYQAQVQRACSVPSLKNAQTALWIGFIVILIVYCLVFMIGILISAAYSDCHPVKYGMIAKNDQIVPLFVLDVLYMYPGLPGLFIACILSGSLSTMSSYLNSMSAVVLEDFIKPLGCKSLVNTKSVFLAKIIVILTGIILFGLSVGVSSMDTLAFQFAVTLSSLTSGPLLGIFIAGMFLPWTNHIGALVGFFTSTIFMAWLCFGSMFSKSSGYTPLPVSLEKCYWNESNTSSVTQSSTTMSLNNTMSTTTLANSDNEGGPLDDFYDVSYMWFSVIGTMVSIIVALVVSFITGPTKPENVDSRLVCPVFDKAFRCLPEKVRKPLRFGVAYNKQKTVNDNILEDPIKEQETKLACRIKQVLN